MAAHMLIFFFMWKPTSIWKAESLETSNFYPQTVDRGLTFALNTLNVDLKLSNDA